MIQFDEHIFQLGGNLKHQLLDTLPETNSSHLPGSHPERKLIFQPSIFRGKLLVSGRVALPNFLDENFLVPIRNRLGRRKAPAVPADGEFKGHVFFRMEGKRIERGCSTKELPNIVEHEDQNEKL